MRRSRYEPMQVAMGRRNVARFIFSDNNVGGNAHNPYLQKSETLQGKDDVHEKVRILMK
jgi:hypothetical protein